MSYKLNETNQIVDDAGTVYEIANSKATFDAIRSIAHGAAFDAMLGAILKSAKKIERDAMSDKRDALAQYISTDLAKSAEQAALNKVASEFAGLVKGKLSKYAVDAYTPKPKDEDERFILTSKVRPNFNAIADELGEFDAKQTDAGWRVVVADPEAYKHVEPLFAARAALIGKINKKASELGVLKAGEDAVGVSWDGTTPVLKAKASAGTGEPRIVESHKGRVIETSIQGKVLKGTWDQIKPQILTLVPNAVELTKPLAFSPAHFVSKGGAKKVGAIYVKELA